MRCKSQLNLLPMSQKWLIGSGLFLECFDKSLSDLNRHLPLYEENSMFQDLDFVWLIIIIHNFRKIILLGRKHARTHDTIQENHV